MKKLILAVIALLIIGAAVLFSNLGSAVKTIIETAGSQALGTKVSVGSVKASLSDGAASIGSLSVANPKGYSGNALQANSISASLGHVDGQTLAISEIDVDGLTVTYELGAGGSNLDALKKNIKSSPDTGVAEAGSSKKSNYNLIIDKIVISNAQVIPAVGGINKKISVPRIVITGIGNKSNPATPAQVAARIMNQVLAVSSAAVMQSGLSTLPAGNAVNKAQGALKGLLGK